MKLPRQATPFKGLMNRIIWAASPAFLGGFFPAQPSLYQRLGAGAKTGCKVPIKLCIERRHVFCSQEMLCKRSTHLFFIAVAWSEGRPMLKSSRRRHRGELAALLHRGHPLPVHRRCRDGMDGIRLSRSGHRLQDLLLDMLLAHDHLSLLHPQHGGCHPLQLGRQSVGRAAFARQWRERIGVGRPRIEASSKRPAWTSGWTCYDPRSVGRL